MANVPPTLTLRFCSSCGRDDRKTNLPIDHVVGNHSMKKCTGTIKNIAYVPVMD